MLAIAGRLRTSERYQALCDMSSLAILAEEGGGERLQILADSTAKRLGKIRQRKDATAHLLAALASSPGLSFVGSMLRRFARNHARK